MLHRNPPDKATAAVVNGGHELAASATEQVPQKAD